MIQFEERNMPGPDQNSLANRIRNIPPVTRFFTISTVVICIITSLNIIQPSALVCDLKLLLEKVDFVNNTFKQGSISQRVYAIGYLIFQCHRFFSAFLLPLGILMAKPFEAILDIYFFYTFANHLESREGKFRGNFPDCLWFTLVTGTIIVLLTLSYQFFYDSSHFFVHHQMMLSCVTYLWSRSLKNSIINFLGLVPIKAYYLPLFNLFFKLIVNGYPSFMDTLVGIWGGYLYQCIQSDTLPIYNLFPGAYARYLSGETNPGGRRVGTLFPGGEFRSNNTDNATLGDHSPSFDDFIGDSIFDKGHLKAPVWLYGVLSYPINSSMRTTAFYPRPQAGRASTINISSSTPINTNGPAASNESSGSSTGSSWFSGGNPAFKGKGRRLGD